MTQSPGTTPSFQPPLSPDQAATAPSDTPTRLTQAAAFDLLRTVVAEFETSGRKPYAAGIKPQMQARTGNTFSESDLGYVTFREFLEAAAQAAVIEVQPEGPHLRLHVPGVSSTPTRPRSTSTYRESSWVHIPSHLWIAFVDWSPGKRRFYDKTTETALMFAADPVAGESHDEVAKRELVAADPNRFVEIQPLTFHTQVGWMKEYANTLADSNDRRLLTLILENDSKPANAFNLFIRRDQNLLAAWKAFKVERVREAIRAWMKDHEIDASVLDGVKGTGSSVETATHVEATHLPAQRDVERVRSRVLAAIDRMPLADLLRLSIPVEYMIEVD